MKKQWPGLGYKSFDRLDAEAFKTFADRIKYSQINWTEKEIRNLQLRVQDYFEILQSIMPK